LPIGFLLKVNLIIYILKMVWDEIGSRKFKSTTFEKDDIEEPMGGDKLKGGHKCCRW
jgi:hypothetical protein